MFTMKLIKHLKTVFDLLLIIVSKSKEINENINLSHFDDNDICSL